MTWVKLDDQFFAHPKVRAAGPRATLLYLAGLTYAARYMTDGAIPKSALAIIAAESFSKPADARALVEVGMWHDEGDEYRAHDYLEHNPSRAEVESKRDSKRMAGAIGAAKRWASDSHSTSHDRRNAPDPSPTPIEEIPSFEEDFAALWEHYPRKVDKGAALAQYQARRRQGAEHSDLLAAVMAYAEASDGQDRQYVKHAATFLGKRGAWAEWVAGPPVDALPNAALTSPPQRNGYPLEPTLVLPPAENPMCESCLRSVLACICDHRETA